MLNRAKMAAWIAAGLAVVSAGLIFVPSLIGMDGMRGGYALSFVSCFVALSAGAAFLILRYRAAVADRLLDGRDLLARWVYAADEWERYLQSEEGEMLREKGGLWAIVAAWALLIGGLFWLLDPEAGWIVMAVLAGITAMLAGFAFGLPRLWSRRTRGAVAEARIGPDGVWLGGTLVVWGGWGSRLESVRLVAAQPDRPAQLCLAVSTLTRAGRQVDETRVPVPAGREEEAHAVAARLSPDRKGRRQ